MKLGNFQYKEVQDEEFSGEKRLLVGILVQAIKDAFLLKDRAIKREAKRWFASNSFCPFSYLWLCQKLDIDEYDERVVLEKLKVEVNKMRYAKIRKKDGKTGQDVI